MSYSMHEGLTVDGQVSKRKREEIFNDELLGLEILCYLDDIGFSTKHPGTYLYKDLILEMIYVIYDDNVSEEEKIKNVQNPYSVIYDDVATFQYDIEILEMHKFIYLACPSDELKKGYMNKAFYIANEIITKEKGKLLILSKKD